MYIHNIQYVYCVYIYIYTPVYIIWERHWIHQSRVKFVAHLTAAQGTFPAASAKGSSAPPHQRRMPQA